MTKDDIIAYKAWFSEYCRSFYSSSEEDQSNILLKERHTLKVCENILLIANALSFSSNQLLIAETVALFHDIGRFEQYARYKTFRDSISINHGLLGSEILLRENVLRNLDKRERELILQAVRFHNAFAVPAIPDPETVMFIKLIRDADKLDIWRVFFDYYDKPVEDRPSAVGLGFSDIPEYSGEVLSLIFSKQLVPLSLLKTLNDFKLTQLAWIYDLNFTASLKLVVENDYINRLSSTLPQTNEIRKVVAFLHDFVANQLKNGSDGKVYFIGAGPGDPELITLKGRKLLDSADMIIYAGSLVNPELLDNVKAEIFDSSGMTLDETTDIIKKSVDDNKLVVRLHTGDTAFYSAISEQIDRLRELNIGYEVVPGVSSAMAGAAVIGQELTIPEISQTVIFTRIEGRTPVPETEKLSELASHRATMVIFLSIGMIDNVRDELLKGYPEDTPVVVVEKASWPGQRVIRGDLKDIADLVKSAGIKKTALIYVGEALRASELSLKKESRLYSKDFTHGYRTGTKDSEEAAK